jgi:serine/threonine protein phosphatase PrpC
VSPARAWVFKKMGNSGLAERFRIGYDTDPGCAGKKNEDRLHADPNRGLFIVADGMGGHNAGELASAIAVETIAETVEEKLDSEEEVSNLLRDSILSAHQAILRSSRLKKEWQDMGTTVVSALFDKDRVVIAHVGDSRAYLIEHGTIRQLTEDHSFVYEWLKEGTISPEEARMHRARHGLTQAVGIDDEIEPDTSSLPWDGKGCLLLCSDGLSDMLWEHEILDIVTNSNDPDEACRVLTRVANERGGRDNISVILVCDPSRYASGEASAESGSSDAAD